MSKKQVKKCCSLKLDKQLDKYIYRDLMYNSQQLSTKVVSIKNHEIQISKSVFHAYPSYLCRVSFLTTLDIYKNYFKGRHKAMQEQYMHCVTKSRNSSSSSFSLKKLLCLYAKGFVIKKLLDLHC